MKQSVPGAGDCFRPKEQAFAMTVTDFAKTLCPVVSLLAGCGFQLYNQLLFRSSRVTERSASVRAFLTTASHIEPQTSPHPFVTIRPARLEDASLAADLIYLSMGVEIDWLFGQEPGYSTRDILIRLYQRKNNRISYPYACIAAWKGQEVGLLLAFPGKILRRLEWRTGLQLVPIFGLGGALRLVRRMPAYGDLVETQADEFYISNLAVLPAFQGRGVGQALLEHAEILARTAGLGKCSLIVSYAHEPARRLYEKIGYQTVQMYDILHPQIAEGSGGFQRMLKLLAAA